MAEFNSERERSQHMQKFTDAMSRQPKPANDKSLTNGVLSGDPIEPHAVIGVNRAIGEKVFKDLTKKP